MTDNFVWQWFWAYNNKQPHAPIRLGDRLTLTPWR